MDLNSSRTEDFLSGNVRYISRSSRFLPLSAFAGVDSELAFASGGPGSILTEVGGGFFRMREKNDNWTFRQI